MFDMLAMLSVSVVAPTTIGVEALQGDMVQLSPPLLLPAAHQHIVRLAHIWRENALALKMFCAGSPSLAHPTDSLFGLNG